MGTEVAEVKTKTPENHISSRILFLEFLDCWYVFPNQSGRNQLKYRI